MNELNLKLPPQSMEAEQSILGGLMLDSRRYDEVADHIKPNDCYTHAHQLIFNAIVALAQEDKPIDIVTVRDYLDRMGQLSAIGGLNYLDQLVRNTPTTVNLKAYAEIIRERSILRQLIDASGRISDSAFNQKERSASDILDFAESTIFNIAQHKDNNADFANMQGLMIKTIDKIQSLYDNQGEISGLNTGYPDLNELTSGLQPSDLIILAGRPAMGKTSFAMNLVENIVHEEPNKAVAIFSLEMPAEQLMMRFLSSLSRISMKNLRSGDLTLDHFNRLHSSAQIMSKLPIYIDDTGGISPTEIRSRIRRLCKELEQKGQELGMIVIDYLQLMQSSVAVDNRVLELSAMTRTLKILAKEMNVPVVVLSQLSRNTEQRTDKRPMMSDLRDSGAIEQDADMILFVYRDEVYNPETTKDKGVAEIIIGKQRNGPIGKVRLAFLGEFTRFESLQSDYNSGL